jgi:hypothetical protein
LIPKYSGPEPIAANKKKYLLDLLSLMPPESQHFYKSLTTAACKDTDPDLVKDKDGF